MVAAVTVTVAAVACLLHALLFLNLYRKPVGRKTRRARLYTTAIVFMTTFGVFADELADASGQPGFSIWIWVLVGVVGGVVLGEMSTRLSEIL